MSDANSSAENIRQLWSCVIQQAWDDLFSNRPTWRQGINEWARHRREAELFLTKSTGEWAASREDVCRAAGIDPDDLRRRAIGDLEKITCKS